MGSHKTAKRRAERKRKLAREGPPPIKGVPQDLQIEEPGQRVALSRLLQPVNVDAMTLLGRYSLIQYQRFDTSLLPRLLQDQEEKYAQRMNPRSLYDPNILKGIVEGLRTPSMNAPNMELLVEATENIRKRLALPSVKISPRSALEALLARQTQTAAGAPFFVKRYAAAYPYLPEAWRDANPALERVAASLWESIGRPDVLSLVGEEFPYLANYRVEAATTASPYRTKHRLVWAAPLPQQIIEAQYAVPIQLLLSGGASSGNDPYAVDSAHGGIFSYLPGDVLHDLIMRDISRSTQVLSIDFSAFDQSVSSELIAAGFDALNVHDPLVRERFATRGLLNPWKKLHGDFGVPSGSVFTNLEDSVINAIAMEYAMLVLGLSGTSRANGDDGIVYLDEEVDVSAFTAALAQLGLSAHPGKQAVDTDSAMFNNSYWGPEFEGPVPSVNKLANSLIRTDTLNFSGPPNPDLECERSLQIFELLRHHPDAKVLLMEAAEAHQGGERLLDYRARVSRLFTEQLGSSPAAAVSYIERVEEQMPLLPEVMYGET